MIAIKDKDHQTIYETKNKVYQRFFLEMILEKRFEVEPVLMKPESQFSMGFKLKKANYIDFQEITMYIWPGFVILFKD